MNHKKYKPFAFKPKTNKHKWYKKTLTKAPIWVSVDLRDGNQSLVVPMTLAQKGQFFDLLVTMGFKHIEVGFPAASSVESEFVRWLIEHNKIPDDVWVQVLVPARKSLIEQTFDALKGIRRAIIHVYSPTSQVQQTKVYQTEKEQMKKMAIYGATLVKETAKKYPKTMWMFQYSPEGFSQTDPDFAVSVCQAVCDVWRGQKVIINLPATVEVSSPNLFADQVEYVCRHLAKKDVTISLHTHNDRGCAVAAAELGLLAGAERVEGTLFGNGERTGNADIVTMALNLYTQGIDPQLDLSHLSDKANLVTYCNQLPIHPRHPYVGELVFTAFSGSHQDAIKKSLDFDNDHPSPYWDVAYLPIDPKDLGRNYQEVVRINSQSGKGGAAYVLQHHYGFCLPRWLQVDFACVVQKAAETKGELKNSELLSLFSKRYISTDYLSDYELKNHLGGVTFTGKAVINGKTTTIKGTGGGALSAFIDGLSLAFGKDIYINNYAEHTINTDDRLNKTDNQAAAYVALNVDGALVFGVGVSSNSVDAMLRAALAALSFVYVV